MSDAPPDISHLWLDHLLELEDGLTEWEVEFIDSLDNQRRGRPNWLPSEKQRDVLERIYDKFFS